MKRWLPVAALLALPLVALRADEDAPDYDWGVAYWMSYDNNLEPCGKPIIKMIRAGVTSPREVVAVQADFSDEGMHRYVMKGGAATEETRLASDDSASEDEAISYFEWFTKTYRCKRYVFTFLDHGGRIDEMCNDDHPGKSGKSWMSGRIMGEKFRGLAKKLEKKWQLLFLQQCGRGSLENLYSFRGTAEYVMSSPVPVGAPNTYYTALHEWLPEHPDATGAEVAAKIAEKDRDYTIYTCLRTSALAELPKKLDAVITPFLANEKLAAPRRQRVIHDVGEPIVDAKRFFEAVAAVNSGTGTQEVATFFEWTRKDLFTLVKARDEDDERATTLSGLSIFQAQSASEAGRYAFLDLYKESKLGELMRRLAAVTPHRRALRD